MLVVWRSDEFDGWLRGLRDTRARARILARLRNATLGNFGDCKPVGEGISEMRVHYGPGYRIYFMRSATTVYVVLAGGDKSTQQNDIELAKAIARRWREAT